MIPMAVLITMAVVSGEPERLGASRIDPGISQGDPSSQPASACQAVKGERKGYLWRVAVSLNQTVNALTLGDPDETLSSRWGRTKGKSWWSRQFCKVLDRFDECHCTRAVEFDVNGEPVPHQLWRREENE